MNPTRYRSPAPTGLGVLNLDEKERQELAEAFEASRPRALTPTERNRAKRARRRSK